MSNEKKLIVSFKAFVQKVFLPSLKKTDPQITEWNRFSQLLNDCSNADQIQNYVDSVNASQVPTIPSFEKRELPFKKRNEEPNSSQGFNPSKTFGGERARMMFQKGEMDDFDQRREGGGYNFGTGSRAEDRNRSFQPSAATILPGLQKLCKVLLDNQQRLQNLMSTPVSPTKYY